MMAAIAASQVRPHSVLLLDKEERVGRKLMATGNGRCNLLNSGDFSGHYHGSGAECARRLLRQIPPGALLSLFRELGLCCREEEDGRVYPFSGQAGAVVDVLRAGCHRYGVESLCGAEVVRVEPVREGFRIGLVGGGTRLARRLIVAAGSKAAPSLGGGDGAYSLLKAFGHTVTPLRPALVPLKLPTESIRGLKGVRVQGNVGLWVDSKPVRSEAGELLFTEYGVSGVAAMQLARDVGIAIEAKRKAFLSICLMDAQTAREQVALRPSLFAGMVMEDFFVGLLHRRIGLCLLREVGLGAQDSVSQEAAFRLAPLLTDWRIPVLGTLPFSQAQCAAGGVPLMEFDPETLESRRMPGLYACGEALDVDGDCGGYNLMWAWVSGMTAGDSAARGKQS